MLGLQQLYAVAFIDVMADSSYECAATTEAAAQIELAGCRLLPRVRVGGALTLPN